MTHGNRKFSGVRKTVCALLTCLSIAGITSAVNAQGANPILSFSGISVEGVLLKRGDLDGTLLTKADDTNGSSPGVSPPDVFIPVSISQLDPGTGQGVRVTVDGRLFGREIRYSVLGAWGFEGSFLARDLNGLGNVTDAAFELPGADFAQNNSDQIFAMRVEHESWFVSADSSLYPDGPPNGSSTGFLWGTRSIFLNDELKAAVFHGLIDLQGIGNDIDRVKVDVDNRMLGLQVGLEGERQVSGRVTIGGFVKGGLLANFVDVDSSWTQDDTPNFVNKSYDDTAFAQFAEVSGSVSFKLGERTSLVASGMVLWINGIQEGADSFHQVSDAQATSIDADSDALFYGGRLGIKIKLGGSGSESFK